MPGVENKTFCRRKSDTYKISLNELYSVASPVVIQEIVCSYKDQLVALFNYTLIYDQSRLIN